MMGIFDILRRSIGPCAIVVALAGCGVRQLPANPPTSFQSAAQAQGDLLYVSDEVGDVVYEYSLPGGKLEGTLTGFSAPDGLCSDINGDVYVTNADAQDVLEYAHGGTSPIKTLKEPSYYPVDCSVDSSTGDLAVANIVSVGSNPGDLAIYKKAAGKPKAYHDPKFQEYWFCSYDDQGNLFVVGVNRSHRESLAELPKGQDRLINITLNRKTNYVGTLQGDGRTMTVPVTPHWGVYRLRISGSKGTLEGPTVLRGPNNLYQYAFYKNQLIGAVVTGISPFRGVVRFWPYPQGGKATKTITGFAEPAGLTVSLVAPK